MRFCTDKCGVVKEDEEGGKTCSYCRGEKITEGELLAFCLKKLNISQAEATKLALTETKVKKRLKL
jgi:hypothetical protein